LEHFSTIVSRYNQKNVWASSTCQFTIVKPLVN
jgi:hypothetical protein